MHGFFCHGLHGLTRKDAHFCYFRRMKKSFLPLVIVVLSLTACGEKDSICACIEAGDKLNKLSSEVLEGKKSDINQQEWKKLKVDKEKKCKEFETMSGPEMLERKKNCE